MLEPNHAFFYDSVNNARNGSIQLPSETSETLGMFLANALEEKLKTQRKRTTQIKKTPL